jgi:enoyl-CoA hydratase
VAAVVLTGADPAFCAGFDLRALADEDVEDRRGRLAHQSSFVGMLPPHDVPIVGAVNGPAVTGGLELALACDVLVASDRARFADTHARVGVVPGGGLTILLPRRIGPGRARLMSLTGDFVDAATALAWGLADEVVPHAGLLDRAGELARSMAEIPAATVAEVRRLYDAMAGRADRAAYAEEAAWSRRWMAEQFDPDRLGVQRESIMRRGRGEP